MFSILLLSSGFFELWVGPLGRKIVAWACPGPSQEKKSGQVTGRAGCPWTNILLCESRESGLACLLGWIPQLSWSVHIMQQYQKIPTALSRSSRVRCQRFCTTCPVSAMDMHDSVYRVQWHSVRRGRQQRRWYNHARARVTVEAAYMIAHDNDCGGAVIATLTLMVITIFA